MFTVNNNLHISIIMQSQFSSLHIYAFSAMVLLPATEPARELVTVAFAPLIGKSLGLSLWHKTTRFD